LVIALGSPVLETMFNFNQRQQQLTATNSIVNEGGCGESSSSTATPPAVATIVVNKNTEEVEMDAEDVPPETFEQLLNFLYLKPVTLSGETVFAVMATGLFIFKLK
jgi:hypothetical protein